VHRRAVLVLPFTACLLDPACLLDIGPQAYARHPVSGAPEKYTASGDLRRVRIGIFRDTGVLAMRLLRE